MFKIGDYVVNSKNGVCLIEDIQKMNFSGTEKEYYLLIPLQEKNAKLYIPVNTASQRVRLAMNSEQALSFINEIKNIEKLSIFNDKDRENVYKDILKSCDPKAIVSIIKTLYVRRQNRLNEGKKNTTIDEHYFKIAENHLYGELSFALQISKEEVIQMIIKNIESTDKT